MNAIRFPFLLCLAALLISCSHSSMPTAPSGPALESMHPASSPGQVVLWGLWEVKIDDKGNSIEAVPLRGAEFTCNVVNFLNNTVGGLRLDNFHSETQGGDIYIDVDVGLLHPFPGLDSFTGFDVMGVFLGDVSGTYLGDEPLAVAQDGDFQLTNPDGYTRWFNAPEFADAGAIRPLFGYIPGASGTQGFTPDGTLNPYKYFADGLVKDADAFGFLLANSEDRGCYTPGSLNWRHYSLKRPLAAAPDFQYAVIAHWEPNKNHPMPPGSLDDFPISANADEAVAISVVDSSNLFYDPSTSGGNVILDISPWDWSSTWDGYTPEYQIRLYSSAWTGPFNVDMTPTQIIGKQVIFHAEFPIDSLTSSEPLTVWIEVAYPDLDYTTHLGTPNYATGELTSYFSVDIPVSPAHFLIMVTAPNGGEVWYVGGDGEITWDSSVVISAVNIEYSKDDFASDINLIVWNEPNIGSYLWQNIPNDPTTNAKVRVTSAANPAISDISDGPFTIAVPDCTPEEHFEIEPNDTPQTATAMQWDYAPETDGFPHTGQICPDGDIDWYSFEVTIGTGSFMVSCLDITEGQTLGIELQDESGTILDKAEITPDHVAQAVRLPGPEAPPGTYYLGILGSGGIPEYDIHPLRWPSWNEGFTFFETEPNGTSGTADPMPLSYDPDGDAIQYTGEQDGGDDDWFSIDTPTDGILVIHMADYDNASNEAEYLTLYDSSLTQLDTVKIWYQDGSRIVWSKESVPAGTYYVLVTANTFTHRYVLEPNLLVE